MMGREQNTIGRLGGLAARTRPASHFPLPTSHFNHRPPWMEKPSPIAAVAKAIILVCLAVLMLFPLVYVLATSFSSYQDVAAGGVVLFPKHPTLDAYRTIFRNG